MNFGGKAQKIPVLKKTYDINNRRFDGNSLERKIVIFFSFDFFCQNEENIKTMLAKSIR